MLIFPKLKYNYIFIENTFSHKHEKAFTGTIIKRYGTKSNGIMFHYAIILGVDKNNNILVIHNDSKGIEILTFEQWNENWGDNWTVEFINKFENTTTEILSRVIEVSNKHFHNRLNNCEHFVNYVVFGKGYSLQSDLSEIIQKLIFMTFDLKVESGTDFIKKKYATFKKNIFKPKTVKVKD